jgi:hypothetical protein
MGQRPCFAPVAGWRTRFCVRDFLRRDAPRDEAERVARMRYFLISLAFLFGASQAQAQTASGPSPESDLGFASVAMVAAAAFLAYRLRRR